MLKGTWSQAPGILGQSRAAPAVSSVGQLRAAEGVGDVERLCAMALGVLELVPAAVALGSREKCGAAEDRSARGRLHA